jgi:hypothetical protein
VSFINIEPPEGLLSAPATSTLPLSQAGPAFISIGASTSKVSFINIKLPEGLMLPPPPPTPSTKQLFTCIAHHFHHAWSSNYIVGT